MSLSRGSLRRIVPLVGATIVVVIGALLVGMGSMREALQATAEGRAYSWGQYLVENVSNIQAIIDGRGTMSVADVTFLERNRPVAMANFRVYDWLGYLRFDSRRPNGLAQPAGQPPEQDVRASSVLTSNGTLFRVFASNTSAGDRTLAETIFPLVSGNVTLGVVAVSSDETYTWAALLRQYRIAGLQMAGLVLLAFAVPGFLYLQRTRQLDFARDRLVRTSEYDELTGVLNRAAFGKAVADKIENVDARTPSFAVHIIDLDRFKDINDSRGHAFGDEVLRQIAGRMRSLLGTREWLARLGADEFAVCQPFFDNNPEMVLEFAETVTRELRRPLIVSGVEIQAGASIGYARFPQDGSDVSQLMRAADIALFNAKTHSRGKAVEFDRSMEAERQIRQGIERRLRTAITNEEFELNFQPLCDSNSGDLRGFEALLRLNGDDGKPISPDNFIPIAEEVGLISEIGLWVLHEACKIACDWPESLRLSVNMSPAQFRGQNVPRMVSEVLAQTGLKPDRLELEVTESLLIDDTKRVLRELMEIKAMGVTIALDDFGTGYSSLGHLWQFPFDKLKVDKSFMSDLTVPGSKSREILSTIVALGRVLDVKVTAEGVETQDQASVLRELNCDLVQGFLYGRPMKTVDVAAAIMKFTMQSREGRTRRDAERRVAAA